MGKEREDTPAEVVALDATGFQALVFRQLPGTEDFSRSQTIVLPGVHASAGAAWAAVHAAVLRGRAIVGGMVQPCGVTLG